LCCMCCMCCMLRIPNSKLSLTCWLIRKTGLSSLFTHAFSFHIYSPGGLDSLSASSFLPPFSPSRNNTAHPSDQGAQGLSLTSPVLIAQSEHYLSPSKLRDIVAASDLANTSDKKLMHVAYGRAPLVIGSIGVTSLTTYGECLKLVLPLVAEYVSTIAANESIHNELVSKFSLMDAKGEALTQEHLQVCLGSAQTSVYLFGLRVVLGFVLCFVLMNRVR